MKWPPASGKHESYAPSTLSPMARQIISIGQTNRSRTLVLFCEPADLVTEAFHATSRPKRLSANCASWERLISPGLTFSNEAEPCRTPKMPGFIHKAKPAASYKPAVFIAVAANEASQTAWHIGIVDLAPICLDSKNPHKYYDTRA